MDQEYTEEEVNEAIKLFFKAKGKNHHNDYLAWEVAEGAEWDGKEMNKLFQKYIHIKDNGLLHVADAMDETIVRLTGWSFETYLVNTFLRSQFKPTEEDV